MSAAPATWDNRIVGYGEVAPDQLLAHFANPKIHPDAQTQALKGVLAELGWIDSIKVSVDSGRVIDGHDRIKAALQAQQPTVPVTYVKLTEAEELYALATFDPVGALAGQDAALLAELLADVQTGDAAVQALLSQIAESAGIIPPDFAPVDISEQGRLDERARVTCPECGHEFTP